jgi:glycosyltransferase involved in cell wall biosynthesis
VESIFCGTPVITVPVDGYEPSSFLRFANTVEDFSNEIDYLKSNPINRNSTEYKLFLQENSWSRKSELILDVVRKIKSGMVEGGGTNV